MRELQLAWDEGSMHPVGEWSEQLCQSLHLDRVPLHLVRNLGGSGNSDDLLQA